MVVYVIKVLEMILQFLLHICILFYKRNNLHKAYMESQELNQYFYIKIDMVYYKHRQK